MDNILLDKPAIITECVKVMIFFIIMYDSTRHQLVYVIIAVVTHSYYRV